MVASAESVAGAGESEESRASGRRERRWRRAATALTVLGAAQIASASAYLLVRGAPRLVEGVALSIGLVYPFICAAWAQRPRGYVIATRVALALALAVTTTLSMVTGGLASPFLPILVTIPSADFSATGPRGVLALGGLAIVAAAAVALVDALGWLDHLALPAAIQGSVATIWLLHCVVVMVAVNLGLARARARATQDLAKARDEALAASRTKSSFLAIMSHELRTPLAGLTGVLDLLAESTMSGPTRGYLEVAQTSARSLRALLDDILDFSKIEAGHLDIHVGPTRPCAIVREVAALFAVAAAERGVELIVDVVPACDELGLLDAIRLRQVVSNLVGNAIKFTERGHVAIRSRVEEGPRRLRIVVEDTGIGIPQARRAELFQPFVQVHRPGRAGGTGLGLAISRRLIEAMGGALTLESEVGAGSSFIVDLPFPEAPGGPAAAPEDPLLDAEPSAEPLRVLIAEDSPELRLIIESLILHRGHEVTAVEDGCAASAAAERELFDLILMDMQMPECDGLMATQAIRKLPPPHGVVRIVALSADAFAESRARALAAGFDDYLTKPIEVAALGGALATAARLRDARLRAALDL